MSEIHKVLCDVCKRQEDLEPSTRDFAYYLPESWHILGNRDLCPSCYKKIESEVRRRSR